MAENERRPEADVEEEEERRVQLYPNTVERNNKTGEERHGREDDKTTTWDEENRAMVTRKEETSEGQAQRLQVQPQVHPANTQSDRRIEGNPEHNADSSFISQKVYKKSLSNNKMTLYLVNRDLIVSESKIDKLHGVLLVDPDYLEDKRVFGQVTLTFRYGREDEEVMGLTFCNEAIMCLAQLYPPYTGADHQESTTPLQDALIERLGPNAHAFAMEITHLAPPSVLLVPAKGYDGAPIGTSYDIRVYIAERADEKVQQSSTIRMGIRVIQRTTKPPSPATTLYSVPTSAAVTVGSRMQGSCRTKVTFAENEISDVDDNLIPHAAVEKPFLLSDGRVRLEARLDRAIYAHGDSITVHVNVDNNSNKSVRSIRVFVVQYVDVCMFDKGKFKNIVALVSSKDGCPVGAGSSLKRNYTLRPIKDWLRTKNWIALEDNYTKAGATLASTVICPGNGPEDRNVFAIYVSYYVKVKLLISVMGGTVSLKLPFTLMHSNTEPDLVGFPSPIREPKPLEKAIPEEGETKRREGKKEDNQRNKENVMKAIKKKEKESKITDVDLIEHCDEDGGT